MNKKFKRIIVKIGTGTITSETYLLDRKKLANIVSQIADIAKNGIEVIIVTSGAIGAGMGVLKKKTRPQSLPELQACASIGQSQLMKTYEDCFKKKNLVTAQILLTQEDLTDRKRYLNAKNTLLTLLEEKVIPIINENDTVSTDEIRFGDNDRLSSLVASLTGVDLLIMLTNVDGLCQYDKKTGEKIRCVGVVEKITREIEDFALNVKSKPGVGGMVSKLQAAKIAASSGVHCIIANGGTKDVLTRIIEGERMGTLFLPSRNVIKAKKHWIAYTSKVQGTLKVDAGAKDALIKHHKSLLSSGITEISGKFDSGDVVSITDEKGEQFAKGLINYSSYDVKKIKGKKTSQIHEILGYKYYDEVIHRDNLVIL